MGVLLIVLAGFVLFVLLVIVLIYNSLVGLRNNVTESWSDVDTELKRRYDLIPNLVEAVKGYASHEKKLFERIAQTRSRAAGSNGTPSEQAVDENAFISSIKSLFAVVENYPDLKASHHFLDLQNQLTETEDRIQAARRFFNGNVREYNNRVQMFPSSLIASAFNFRQADFFQIEELQRHSPEVRL